MERGVKMSIKELNAYCLNRGKRIIVSKGKLKGIVSELGK